MTKPFECIKECSQCCIEREYYPDVQFGKIGVLLLPDEKSKIEQMARDHNIDVLILPRIGTSVNSDRPEKILAYQLMGKDSDGNTCPFLDIESDKRSPHGGLTCKIYEQRPLACRAYPVLKSAPIELDSKCKFCQECGSADSNLDSEIEALVKIKNSVQDDSSTIWRYATGIGDNDRVRRGWIKEE